MSAPPASALVNSPDIAATSRLATRQPNAIAVTQPAAVRVHPFQSSM